MSELNEFTSPTSPFKMLVISDHKGARVIILDKGSDAGRDIGIDREQMLTLHAQLAKSLGFTD